VVHALVFDQAFGAAVQAVSHLGDQIAHIVNTSIPNAISAAEANAGATTARAIQGVESAISKAAGDTVGALSGVDAQIYQDIGKIENTIASNLKAAVGAAVTTTEHYADGLYTDAKNYADTQVKTAEGLATAAVDALGRTLGQQLSNLTQTVADNLTAAENFAKAQANTVYNEVEGDLSTTAKALSTEASAAESLAQTAINTAASDLTTAENYAASQASAAASAGRGAAAAAGAAAASTAEQALEGALGGIYTDLTGKALAVNGDLTTAEGLIAGAILTAIGSVAARVSKLEECSVGVCSDSPNNFGNLLQDALGLATFAGLGGFLAYAIQHPAAAENQYADAIGALFSTGENAFQDILNL